MLWNINKNTSISGGLIPKAKHIKALKAAEKNVKEVELITNIVNVPKGAAGEIAGNKVSETVKPAE